jgi:hypothetical protein
MDLLTSNTSKNFVQFDSAIRLLIAGSSGTGYA